MKRKALTGILCGLSAGILDAIPMVLQDLSWDANLSALTMWIIIGFFISTVEIRLNAILKGILISWLCLAPCAILIGWKEPSSLIPILIITTILGGLLGFLLAYLNKRTVIQP